MTVYLGIDLGEKRIGLALGSSESRLARPFGVFEHRNRKMDINTILQIIQQNNVEAVVIGASFQEDGTLNSMGRHSVSFGNALRDVCSLPVDYQDEAFSTVDAGRIALDAGKTLKKRRGHQDAIAAVVILQTYLDSKGVA